MRDVKKVIVTGASGLIGSEAAKTWISRDAAVWGVDNNERMRFFGPQGDTSVMTEQLVRYGNYTHCPIDIRDRIACIRLFDAVKPDVVIHCAAQPSHDKAASIPLVDFDVNAVGTINILESVRQTSPDAVVIHMSTNKVYGDAPNDVALVLGSKRYDYHPLSRFPNGIDESLSIDNCTHSIFGASKVAADIMAQEYGRYYKMNVGVFRGGCLTGPQHAGVELHGFMSYIIKCHVQGREYKIFGHGGKQVRDQIHSYDVISAMDAFIGDPKQGVAYNLGGGKDNSRSILEVIDTLESLTGRQFSYEYINQPRVGDHICYYTNMGKFMRDYPAWKMKYSVDMIISEMLDAEIRRNS